MKEYKNKNRLIKILYLGIILDIVTTIICIMIGGVEYNPISIFFIQQSIFLFVAIKLNLALGIYILNNYTTVFNNKIMIIIIFFITLSFIIVVLLNSLYIILKLTGMI